MWKLIGPLISVHRLVLFLHDVYRFPHPSVHPVVFSADHPGMVPVHDVAERKGDRQRKQQDGPMDQVNDTHHEGTRQVDETRQRVLSTSTHLWLHTVRRSNTWWTIVLKKATAVAEMSKTIFKKTVLWMKIHNLISFCFSLWVYSKTALTTVWWLLIAFGTCHDLAVATVWAWL